MEDEKVMLGGGCEDPWVEEGKFRLSGGCQSSAYVEDERVRLLRRDRGGQAGLEDERVMLCAG
jgi:hypothetical protein